MPNAPAMQSCSPAAFLASPGLPHSSLLQLWPRPSSTINVSPHHLAGNKEQIARYRSNLASSKSGYDLALVRTFATRLLSLCLKPSPQVNNTLLAKSRDTQRTATPGRLLESLLTFSQCELPRQVSGHCGQLTVCPHIG
ncbi:hypothetical protein CPAR01_16561 [Colletotrichum paranaense]|uniref:Uncharacterized protein n=3 Tax=Colletotrichum acutatum species complex TaxID=2707335 RepID=A0AAI9UIE0_9PEZI|nr:uncharacterized protein CPAR01_16561 [Colletotrichum paranaense]KAK1459013.1 hypothetical protein CMEL01_02012 [Colletotrichum melonis]KAK1516038.1 hypothetical protein CPAR01_16561 [Colletotrichum paranaense]